MTKLKKYTKLHQKVPNLFVPRLSKISQIYLILVCNYVQHLATLPAMREKRDFQMIVINLGVTFTGFGMNGETVWFGKVRSGYARVHQ
jgi:hypothetical protein